MSYGYGGRANPYDQRSDSQPQSYGQPSSNYGQRQYGNAPAMGGRDEYGSNVEMEPLTQNGAQYGQQSDPNAILNECREIDRAIDSIDLSLKDLKQTQTNLLNNPDAKSDKTKLDEKATETTAMCRSLAGRIKAIKMKPESGSPKNAPQVGKVDRRLQAVVMAYRTMDADYQGRLREQMARQYRIVRPEASEAEVRRAVEDNTEQQVFSQALMQSNRRGQAQSTLNAVESRHQEIQKVGRQMEELAELFEDMQNLVVQQEAAVVNIEMKGEEVVENMDKGTEQIGVAIKSARNARKWKWWCLGITILIIIIIVVVVLIYKFVIQAPVTVTKPAGTKRFVLTDILPLDKLTMRPVVSGVAWTGDNVVPGKPWVPEKRALKWAA